MKKITLIVGTRPNYIKAFPVYDALQQYSEAFKLKLIHTGQHYDQNMNEIFFNELNMKKPDVQFTLDSIGECAQLTEIMMKLHEEFKNDLPDLVIVFGDVTSTLAGALVANKMKIKLAHIESGLRSFDMTMPEEINRILIDSISDYLFITEQSGLDNLIRSHCLGKKMLVGNTMIDTLVKFNDIINKNLDEEIGENFIVVTIHRQSNVDNPIILTKIIESINEIAATCNHKFIFPIHHRTKLRMKNLNLEIHPNVKLTDPLGYIDFMKYIKKSQLVVTDSGGIQEETSFLGIPCVTLRENTERPATLIENGGLSVLSSVDELRSNIPKFFGIKSNIKIHLWDGNASQRIAKELFDLLMS